MRPIIIGQAPSRGGDPGRPVIDGSTGKNLMHAMQVTEKEYEELFERVNLLNEFPGKHGKGDSFPIDEAKQSADELAPKLRRRHVLLLGRNVARAFGVEQVAYLCWAFHALGFWFAVVPHTSGVNRWWNSEKNRALASYFFKSVIHNWKKAAKP